MKRYLTFVVLALSLAVLGGCGKNAENGTGKAEETVKEQGGEKKEEATVEEKHACLYRTISYDMDGSVISHTEYETDKEGRTVKNTAFNPDGSIYEEKVYTYEEETDKDGKVISRTCFANGSYKSAYIEYDKNGNETRFISYDEAGSEVSKSETEYDENGKKVKVTDYDTYSDTVYMVTEYDGNGNTLLYTYFNSDGSKASHGECAYDGKGNKISEASYYGDGSLFYKYEYSFDSNENLTKQLSYDNEGNVYEIYEYAYDSEGRKIKFVENNSYQGTKECEYTYEIEEAVNGNITKVMCYRNENGATYPDHSTEYDSEGNVIKESYFLDNGGLYNVMMFDGKGNCIRSEYYDTGFEYLSFLDETIYLD